MSAVVVRVASLTTSADGAPPSFARPAWIAAGQARRLDPLAALVCAAVDRLGGLDALPASTAVVVGSAWGNVESTLRMADGMAAYGDAGSSPTAFISSVHHNPAGTLGELRGWHGPAMTISLGGLSGLTALRRALLLSATRGLPTIVVVADLPNPWTARTVAASSGCPWPIGGGATALLVQPGEPGVDGWQVDAAPAVELPTCDAGGETPSDERILARVARRVSAAAVLGCWYPTAALAVAPWSGADAFVVSERDSGFALRMGFRRA